MNPDAIVLYAFVLLGLFTPGPNVILLTASGARFGLWRTLPHVAGVAVGVGLLAAASALGVAALLLALPVLATAMKLAAASWILWMAYGLVFVSKSGARATSERPFTFIEAVLFQAVNPKVWAVALTAASGYALGLPLATEAVHLGLTFSVLNLGVCLFWSATGSGTPATAT